MRPIAASISLVIIASAACGEGGSSTPPDPSCLGKCDEASTSDYEFIVVGSGAGGGPLAANLAREGYRVLLLEAGDYAGDNLTYQVPALHPKASEDPELSWAYMVDHYADSSTAARDTKMVYDETGGQRGVLYPRGSTVGGSTAVNAMIFIAPHDSDWDRVADLTGDASFRPDAMREHFMRVEANRYLDTTSALRGHGTNGWLSVETADPWLALRDLNILHVVTSAASQAGDGFFGTPTELVGLMKRDLNAYTPGRDDLEGVFMIPTATVDGQRNGTREYLSDTIARGFPLTLQTKALVTNVVFADEPDADGRPRAIGVEYLSGQNLYRADVESGAADAPGDRVRALASREVILSAGAFNTPQLLMLSGIGPRSELEAQGIGVRVDLPGVGQNLQDRYEVGIVTEADEDYSLLSDCTFETSSSDPCYREWETGGGPYTTNGGVVGIVRRSSVALSDPDLFIFALPGFFKGYYPGYSRDVGQSRRLLTWAILKGHTRNRAGSVGLRSADPRDQPAIDFAYFAEGGDDDLEAMIDGVEFVRDIIDDTDDLLLGVEEVWPGPDYASREQIGQWVRDESWGHHASCTAKMGGDDDPMAVLDSRFRVRGVAGLRVVDASVFPEIPGFFIVVPVYMMSEKASATIIEDTRLGLP